MSTIRINSHSYNRIIKRITNGIKLLRGIKYIQNAPARPYGTSSATLTPQQKIVQDKHDRTWAFTPDKRTVRFFADAVTLDETRRNK